MLRIERAFHARLPIEVLSEAETIGDILEALEQAPAIPVCRRCTSGSASPAPCSGAG